MGRVRLPFLAFLHAANMVLHCPSVAIVQLCDVGAVEPQKGLARFSFASVAGACLINQLAISQGGITRHSCIAADDPVLDLR